mmetsp:Transcript_9553/g.23664  ORF Transcript_9553/g.23664 Transcript_9553/m.23664 type:complete len:207 (+) Transcript_9553:767-1387(+)
MPSCAIPPASSCIHCSVSSRLTGVGITGSGAVCSIMDTAWCRGSWLGSVARAAAMLARLTRLRCPGMLPRSNVVAAPIAFSCASSCCCCCCSCSCCCWCSCCSCSCCRCCCCCRCWCCCCSISSCIVSWPGIRVLLPLPELRGSICALELGVLLRAVFRRCHALRTCSRACCCGTLLTGIAAACAAWILSSADSGRVAGWPCPAHV